MKPYGRIKTNAYFVHCGCMDCMWDRKTIQRNTARARRMNKEEIEEGLKDLEVELVREDSNLHIQESKSWVLAI